MDHRRGRRVAVAVAALLLFGATVTAVAAGRTAPLAVASVDADEGERIALQPPPHHAATQDVVVAGGLDGRVFAMNAWTGDVLWMFDSGGPMVDSSSCGVRADAAETHWRASMATATPAPTSSAAATGEDTGIPPAALAERTTASAAATTTSAATNAVSTAALSQMVPSYDGRLYHIDGTNVRELDMTMVDIINANGPVRLAHSTSTPDTAGADTAALPDLLLFGEKATKLFSLDATRGIVQPFATPPITKTTTTAAAAASALLFGRAEFKTRAVHARNMSAARCFTISEYFLQFAETSQCAKHDADGGTAAPPKLLVLPKDPDATHPDEEESTIAAYDPWTNKQLWERQIPKFDVITVFGVSAHRSASFFKWTIEGPSSSTQPRKDLVTSPGQQRPAQATIDHQDSASRPVIGVDSSTTPDISNESKHLVKTVPREMATVESEYRLRLLDGNYFLEPHDEETDVRVAGSSSSSVSFKAGFVKRKRRVFWEPMESGGKKGVFITYYHVGAMTLGLMVGSVLIAWGFYVKGLTASGAINALEHDFVPTGHVHQLTIEQSGREKITISSSITRALLLEAAVASGFVPQQVPLLENGEDSFAGATNKTSASQVQFDPLTEAMLLEKFTKMVALEAAAALSGTRLSANNLIQFEHDPDSSTASTMTSSTLTLVSTASSSSSHRLSIQADDPTNMIVTSFDTSSPSQSNMTEDNEGRVVPIIEELESSSDMLVESFEVEEVVDCVHAEEEDSQTLLDVVAGVDAIAASDRSNSKSGGSYSSDTTGSCASSQDCASSDRGDSSIGRGEVSESVESSTSSQEQDDATQGSPRASEVSNPRKVSNASSSSSSPNEAEVLFPFVCQSRFANEFVELSALGKGGFGQVMLAENRLDGRKYAIKRVGLHLKNQTSKTLQKFLREVKILALLDHPNIVRYYQAWLEKVEEGAIVSSNALSSDGGSDATGTARPRNYSLSNLLAPISEMEFSNQHRSVASFYSNGSLDADDGGFEWERNSDDADADVDAWREEDLAADARSRRGKLPKLPSIIEPNAPPKRAAPDRAIRASNDDDDSSCYSTDRCDHWLYIQMQYCAGRNLADFLALPTRKMELPKLMKIFGQIASAIAHVHSCGLIHRDLKPANIFVADTDGDSIKLGDFGLSRYAANVNLTSSTTTMEEQSSTSMFINGGQIAQYSMSKWSMSMSNMSESQDITAGVGTYLYASPEQVAGKKYNAKTDMYSLGMILFELCHERFGTTMERYMTLRNARERIFPGEFVWRKKCPEIMAMLEQLLHPDPMARPDAAEVVQWSQELYELSLAQHHHNASSTMRSPIHHSRSFHGTIPTLGLDHAADSTAFSLQVEARMDSGSDESGSGGSGGSGERRLPNHNLLKELCDVIAEVSGGRMEIKKCGLHLQDGGAQILDFFLDPHLSEEEKNDAALVESHQAELIKVIEALPGVHSVRLGR